MIAPVGSLVWVIIATVLSTIFVTLRLISRLFIIRNHGPDDVSIVAALFCSFGMCILFTLKCIAGAGQSIADSPSRNEYLVRLYFFCAALVYAAGITLTKVSILTQYLRLAVTLMHKRVLYALISFLGIYTVTTTAAFFATCRPLSYFWNKSLNGTCQYNTTTWFVNAACDILSDISLCIYPFLLLKSLCIPPKQKWALIFVFALGGCGCLTSVFRVYALKVAANSPDFVRDSPPICVWSITELNIGICCACLPTIRPLLGRYVAFFRSGETRQARPRALPPKINAAFGRDATLADTIGSNPVKSSASIDVCKPEKLSGTDYSLCHKFLTGQYSSYSWSISGPAGPHQHGGQWSETYSSMISRSETS